MGRQLPWQFTQNSRKGKASTTQKNKEQAKEQNKNTRKTTTDRCRYSDFENRDIKHNIFFPISLSSNIALPYQKHKLDIKTKASFVLILAAVPDLSLNQHQQGTPLFPRSIHWRSLLLIATLFRPFFSSPRGPFPLSRCRPPAELTTGKLLSIFQVRSFLLSTRSPRTLL